MDLSYLILVRLNNKLIKLLRVVTNKMLHFVQPAGSSHVTRSHIKCWLLLNCCSDFPLQSTTSVHPRRVKTTRPGPRTATARHDATRTQCDTTRTRTTPRGGPKRNTRRGGAKGRAYKVRPSFFFVLFLDLLIFYASEPTHRPPAPPNTIPTHPLPSNT